MERLTKILFIPKLLFIGLLVAIFSITEAMAAEHLPLTVTSSNYGSCQYAQSKFSWNNGIYLNGNGFNWDDKYYTLRFDGIPDRVSFSFEKSSGVATGVDWYVAVSSNGSSFSNIWTSSDGSGSKDIEITDKSVRYIKFCYSGNFGGTFKNVTISELKYFNVDKTSLDFGTNQRGNTVASQSITLSHCNAGNPTSISCDDSNFTFSPSTFSGVGRDLMGESSVNVTYKNTNLGTHTGTITITDGTNTRTLTVKGTTQTTYYAHAEVQSTEGGAATVSFESFETATTTSVDKSFGPTTSAAPKTNIYFKAVAAEDYEFVGWKHQLSDNTYVSSEENYTIQNFTYNSEDSNSPSSQALIAVFRKIVLDLEPTNPDYLPEQYKTVTLHRTLLQGYNTIALPFDTDVATLTGRTSDEDWVAQLSAVTYNQHDGFTLFFQKIASGRIHAFKPYILYLSEQVVDPSWTNIDLPAATPATITPATGYTPAASPDGTTSYADWQMTSNFTAAFPMSGLYDIVNSSAALQRGSSTSTLNAFTAYITPAPGAAGIKVRSAFTDEFGTTTYISGLPAADPSSYPSTNPSAPTDLYDLSGRRITTPRRGLFIQGGKKIAIK